MSNALKRYKKLRDWSLFMAVFPFSFLFFIGCMSQKRTIPILYSFESYQPTKIRIIEIEGLFSDPVSYLGKGYLMNGEKKEVYLGTYNEKNVSQIIKKFGENNDLITLNVIYSHQTGGVLYEGDKTMKQIKSSYIVSTLQSFIFLNLPFIICLVIGIANHKKIKHIKLKASV